MHRLLERQIKRYFGKTFSLDVIDENLFYIKELPVNGKDVMDITGFKGKEVGDTLEDLLLMNVNNRQRAISLLEKRKSKVKKVL